MAKRPLQVKGADGKLYPAHLATVLASTVGATEEGEAAILLWTQQFGALAVQMTLQNCASLRQEIEKAELILRQASGNA